jgi:hypothetical protein
MRDHGIKIEGKKIYKSNKNTPGSSKESETFDTSDDEDDLEIKAEVLEMDMDEFGED